MSYPHHWTSSPDDEASYDPLDIQHLAFQVPPSSGFVYTPNPHIDYQQQLPLASSTWPEALPTQTAPDTLALGLFKLSQQGCGVDCLPVASTAAPAPTWQELAEALGIRPEEQVPITSGNWPPETEVSRADVVGLDLGAYEWYQDPPTHHSISRSGSSEHAEELPVQLKRESFDSGNGVLLNSDSSRGDTPVSYGGGVSSGASGVGLASPSSASPSSSSPSAASSSPSTSTHTPSATAPASVKRKRNPFPPDLKKETHLTRLTGACLWCWRNRKRCIKVEGACCRYCNTLLDKIPNVPCFRSRLSSAEVFRRGPTDEFCWTRRRWLKTAFDDPKVWLPSSSPKYLQVQQTGHHGMVLDLTVKEYDPQPRDQDTYTWYDTITGLPGTWKMPRYAVADVDGAQKNISRYVEDHTDAYVEKLISRHDTIPWNTFQMALKMSRLEGSSLLRSTLLLWTASRIIETPWNIVGTETLSQTPDMSPGSPYYQKIPVTPVMDFQIDAITIHHLLLPLRKRVLQDLQRKILDNKQKHFLEIFLCLFVLLNNIELTLQHDRWFAMRWGCRGRWSNEKLVEGVVEGGNVMLTHFHYVTKGYAAFKVNWNARSGAGAGDMDKESSAAAGKPEKVAKPEKREQGKFMEVVSSAAKMQAESLKALRDAKQYESPMFWCSQLFYEGWRPVVSPCA